MKNREIKELIKSDFLRQSDRAYSFRNYIIDFLFHQGFRMLVYYRKAQSNLKIKKVFYSSLMLLHGRRYGIDLKSQTQMGKGVVFTHAYNITISPFAVLGNNINILKGATIGLSGGKKGGAPTIGDRVYIGLNVTIIGRVKIGNDVIFAPNTFCNIDVPDHSIVLGNPCQIFHKENATKDYIFRIV